jgi:hypothetical protein
MRTLWLLGMHRSGTSLTASWLHHCGLNLGSSYIKADQGNIRGYYEDYEIVRFHKQILRDNNLKNDIQVNKILTFKKEHLDAAKLILEKRKNNEFIAWKDPRTCLTLKLWNKISFENKSIVLFRHYNEVINSLVRRKIKSEKKRRNFIFGYINYFTKNRYSKSKYVNSLLLSWIIHNKAILEFLEMKNRKDFIVIKSNQLRYHSDKIFSLINSQFNLNLEYYSFDKIYDNKLMSQVKVNYQYNKDLQNDAEIILKKLEQFQAIK